MNQEPAAGLAATDDDPARESDIPEPASHVSPRILRFLEAERLLHWALAIPFVLLYGSALLLVLFWSEAPPRRIHDAIAWGHRAFGLLLIVLPPLALWRGSSDWRIHLENMREGWRWTRDDIRWILLFPRNAVDSRVVLPEQGKFNAAEKLNFMMVSFFYPLYIVTGLMVWLPGVAFSAYLAHFTIALLGLPLVAGHIFMATINPETKVGLSGMITGWVDRGWASHHYARWFRERIEVHEVIPAATQLLEKPARVRCPNCSEVRSFASWKKLLERSFQVEPLFCPVCLDEISLVGAGTEGTAADAILQHLEKAGADEPYDRRNVAGAA